MDTYGDMVTLLLCFFVLLYSISTVDQTKWENLVKSMNPNAEEVTQVVTDPNIKPGKQEVPGGAQSEREFDQIYGNLQKEMENLGLENSVEMTQGEDFQFISYKDKVFFDGDSPVLKPEGKKVLSAFARATKPAADSIKEIRIKGHTSQAEPNRPNDIQTDRTLAGARSANVVAYLQEKDIIDPGYLVGENYGQFHPIATFETSKGREKNRRVEILILEKGSSQKSLGDYYNEVYTDGGKLNKKDADKKEKTADKKAKSKDGSKDKKTDKDKGKAKDKAKSKDKDKKKAKDD